MRSAKNMSMHTIRECCTDLFPSMPIMVSGQEVDWLGCPCWLKGLIPMPMSAEPPETINTEQILIAKPIEL